MQANESQRSSRRALQKYQRALPPIGRQPDAVERVSRCRSQLLLRFSLSVAIRVEKQSAHAASCSGPVPRAIKRLELRARASGGRLACHSRRARHRTGAAHPAARSTSYARTVRTVYSSSSVHHSYCCVCGAAQFETREPLPAIAPSVHQLQPVEESFEARASPSAQPEQQQEYPQEQLEQQQQERVYPYAPEEYERAPESSGETHAEETGENERSEQRPELLEGQQFNDADVDPQQIAPGAETQDGGDGQQQAFLTDTEPPPDVCVPFCSLSFHLYCRNVQVCPNKRTYSYEVAENCVDSGMLICRRGRRVRTATSR